MDNVDDAQEISFSPPPSTQRMGHSFSPPTPFIRNGIRYNEFREILNTAVQASTQHGPMQRQPEVLGKYKYFTKLTFYIGAHQKGTKKKYL